jgi:hypothetical protein
MRRAIRPELARQFPYEFERQMDASGHVCIGGDTKGIFRHAIEFAVVIDGDSVLLVAESAKGKFPAILTEVAQAAETGRCVAQAFLDRKPIVRLA